MSEMARPGQNVREVFTASKHNRWQRAADVTSNGMVNQTSTVGEAKTPPPTIRNTTGSDLDRFSILALDVPTITPDENLEQFQSRVRFDGTVPTTGDEGRFGIILTDAPDGAIVDAVVSGEVQCKVDVTDITHGYADITVDDETMLTSAASGGAMILTPVTETGEQWVTVRLSNAVVTTIDRVTVCDTPMARQLLVTWTDNINAGVGGAAVVSYTESPLGAVSFTEGWEGFALDPDDSSPVGDAFGTYYSGAAPSDIRYVAFGCVSGSWMVVLGDTGIFWPWNATNLIASNYATGAAPVSFSIVYSGTDVDYLITEVYGVGLTWESNSAAGWTADNKELTAKQAGIEYDTGKYKIGPGNWNDLDYLSADTDVAAADITDATAAGQAILTAANNAAIRTLLNVEDGADVTDATNVTAAGALMDSEVTNLSQVKAFDSSDYATAAQGTLADSAIQSGDLATVATSGDYDDLSNKPTLGTAAAEDTSAFATAAQGTLADSATQPGDLGTAAAEDVGYFATAAQGSTADSTATGLSNHIADSSDAHDASAISVADSGALLTATDVEGALAEIAGEVDTNTTGLSDHLGDTADAHDASAISVADSGGIYTATDVEAALAEVKALADAALQDVIIIQEEQAASTDGGTFTAGAWRTRSLNTESIDTGGNASLSSNQVTLDAGTYDVEFWAVAQRVNRHQSRLQNVTDATTTCLGSTDYAAAGNAGGSKSAGATRFTIASSKAFELQHRCEDTKATNGFGISQSWGVNVYSQVKFHKVA